MLGAKIGARGQSNVHPIAGDDPPAWRNFRRIEAVFFNLIDDFQRFFRADRSLKMREFFIAIDSYFGVCSHHFGDDQRPMLRAIFVRPPTHIAEDLPRAEIGESVRAIGEFNAIGRPETQAIIDALAFESNENGEEIAAPIAHSWAVFGASTLVLSLVLAADQACNSRRA